MHVFIYPSKKKETPKQKTKKKNTIQKKRNKHKIHNTKCECKFTCYFRNHINGRVGMLYNKQKVHGVRFYILNTRSQFKWVS